MSFAIVFLAAAAGPLFVPSRNLLAGMIGLTALLTGLTIWGLTHEGQGVGDGRYAALAIAGVVFGSVVRLAAFQLKVRAEDQALRRQIGRELPDRHR
ncbi:MAG TPA: hypothetical protein VFN88_08785 [Caulobacteraceae bacterium]|nr:hypothetical protein [Caulobacteraceae bacterium]